MAQQTPGSAEIATPVETSSMDALMARLPESVQDWVWVAVLLAGALLVALIIHVIVFAVLGRIARRAEGSSFAIVVRQMRWSAFLGFVFLAFKAVLPRVAPHLDARDELPVVNHALSICVLVTITWLLIAIVESIEQIIHARYRIDVEDNLRQRGIQTQTRVLVRALQIAIVVFGAAAILMTFPDVRQFGASLLASAGLAGLVVGLAARPVVANLIAGVQIAITQPIRIDDVVIVEGEWGRVEEITTTYVVVKIWDERRLVVPLSHFIEQPFQNWTRTSAALLGTVYLNVDYRVPLDDLRTELERFVEQRPEWDRRVAQIVVTDAGERSVQIRALVSSGGSGRLWDLRCAVREHLLDWLRRNHPASLPRVRAEIEQPPGTQPSLAHAAPSAPPEHG